MSSTRDPNRKLIREYGITIVFTVIVSLIIRIFIIEAYRIPTVAMRPTFEPGDTVFVGKWPVKPPRRGDLILYSPEDSDKRDYIKRVVGVGGDTIEIKQGRLLINDKVIEPTLPATAGGCGTEVLPNMDAGADGVEHTLCLQPPAMPDVARQVVPAGSVYVLGDLRSGKQLEPLDQGKSWGLISLDALKGQVLCIWLSVEPGSSGFFPKFRFDRMFRRAH